MHRASFWSSDPHPKIEGSKSETTWTSILSLRLKQASASSSWALHAELWSARSRLAVSSACLDLRVPHGSAVLLVPAGIPAVTPGLRACVQEAQAVRAGRSCTDQIQSFLTDEETEAQGAEEACPRLHSESAADSGLNQTFLILKFGLVLSSGCHRASPSACSLCQSSGSASSEDWPWG